MLFALVLFAGSLSFGNEFSTTTPSAKEVQRYRAETYLKESLKISPLGLDVIVGIDRSVHFKFKAHESDVRHVLSPRLIRLCFLLVRVRPIKSFRGGAHQRRVMAGK